MKMRSLKYILFVNVVMILCSVNVWASKKQASKKPNVLFIFADDQSFNTIHALGNQEIKTPNLDKLTNAGISYINAYNMGAWHGAVCVASRAMLNTGMTMWRACANEDRFNQRAESGQMWGNLMKQAGYDTYFAGKWHVKSDPKKSFNTLGTVRAGMPNQSEEGYNRPKGKDDNTWKPWYQQFGGYWKGGKHWSEVLGDEAVAFLDSAKNKTNPFFMYIAFNAPHDPRQSPKRFVDMYPLENISIPKNFVPEHPNKQEIGCYKVPRKQGMVMQRDENLAPFPRTEYSVKVNRQEYYAIITHLDEQLGRILDKLKETGMADNTYIFYSADHGLAVGHHGLMGKQNLYEHSAKAPLIVVGPNVPEGERSEDLCYIQDIMASALDVAGADIPQYVEFRSLMPKAKGKKVGYSSIYGAYSTLQRMVRVGNYKLIVFPEVPIAYMFDLEKDPEEMVNLANNPEFAQKKKELFKELQRLQKQYGDELVIDVSKY